MAQRELSISYGLFTVGGLSSVYQIHGPVTISKGFRESSVEFQVFVTSTTEAAFGASCVALETQFRKPWLPLTVVQGSRVLVAFKSPPLHEVEPEIDKDGSEADTGRTRLYTVRCVVSMPADNVSPTGLRESSADIIAEPSGRRRLIVSGTWTAAGSLSAQQAYDAGIDSYASAIYGALGGTWELASIPRQQVGRNSHEVEFSREYQEILYPEGEGTLDDPEIIGQTLDISRDLPAPGDSPGTVGTGGANRVAGSTRTGEYGAILSVRRLTVIELRYSASIAVGVDPRSKYDSIRGFLLAEIQSVLGEGSYALTTEKPDFDLPGNRLSVNMTAMGATNGAQAIERRISLRDDKNEDQQLAPAWDGQPYSRYSYDGAWQMVRTLTLFERRIIEGTFTQQQAEDYIRGRWSGGADGVGRGSGQWTRGRVNADVALVDMGPDDKRLQTAEISGTLTREYFEPVKSGSTG